MSNGYIACLDLLISKELYLVRNFLSNAKLSLSYFPAILYFLIKYLLELFSFLPKVCLLFDVMVISIK